MAGIKAPMLETMYSYLHDNWKLNTKDKLQPLT
ncbi:hypothetical protein H310_14692 [Aphanomyces invadans]|uniref:Uncharacterized protein n=1 Tax=Aphanomyces invadans TaxID=157072 RepID=A0A024T956_9STRA|nr:hypothetical protein H310_14692 [Aphanomyces invadans]ETV90568.1 hypothetical protein H310_14692 [Aphanomyces invadans]|eukprot:XP_008880818.1 hypothetical protein H310_14692 [Aphanomyces invadans]